MNNIDLSKFSYKQRLPSTNPNGQFPYSFISANSKTLVIVIGDSWTWGADLSENDALNIRNTDNFGAIVSRELSADYLNLGQCGSCNLHIIERIKELSIIIPTLNYEKIWIICTYTEVARSFDGPYDKTVDYCAWFKFNNLITISAFNKLLEFHNGLFQDEIYNLEQKYPHVAIIVGNNFTDPIGMHNKITLLPKTWLQLISEQLLYKEYTSNSCYIMSHWVISKLSPIINGFDNTIDQQLLTEWLIYLINCSKNRHKLTENNVYFAGANHPKKQGHAIWANYILDLIQ